MDWKVLAASTAPFPQSCGARLCPVTWPPCALLPCCHPVPCHPVHATVSVKLRVLWQGDATLTSLSFTALRTAPGLDAATGPGSPAMPLPLGINLDGPTYYSQVLPFLDVWQGAGASDWPAARAGVDADGWPLEVRLSHARTHAGLI